MPIYAFRCQTCDHEFDRLVKLSDPLLRDCPSCGKPELVKQVTAAGFKLKGTGWYVTDFRDKPTDNPAASKGDDANAKKKDDAKGGESKSDGAASTDATPKESATKPKEPSAKPAPPAS